MFLDSCGVEYFSEKMLRLKIGLAMNNSIRQYKKNDLNDLLNLWETSTKLAHPFLTESFLKQERYNIPNIYLPNADTWIAVEKDRVVGFIALIGNEVGALFVEPAYHRQGFGKALMDKARSLHTILEVDVFKENYIGRGFYHRYGFKLLSEKTHTGTGNKMIRLIYKT